MPFSDFLKSHLAAYPDMEPQDILKLCYQAARGAEHLLTDLAAAKRYFDAEFQSVAPVSRPLVQPICREFCRVDLGAWKAQGLPAEWLFRAFVLTASEKTGEDRLPDFLAQADGVMEEILTSEARKRWNAELLSYQKLGTPPIHHSPAYRAAYAPSYRVIRARIVRLFPILEAAARHKEAAPLIIAIDGRAASGKTTSARDLAEILGGSLVHMDDFFLPFGLRSAERMAEVGGNLHRERFAEEVLPYLSSDAPFEYGIFDCSVGDVTSKRRVEARPVRIVEGSYAHHPAFGDYAHVKAFATVDPDEQMRRIVARNGERMAERFRTEWIPAEETYFSAFHIPQNAHVLI